VGGHYMERGIRQGRRSAGSPAFQGLCGLALGWVLSACSVHPPALSDTVPLGASTHPPRQVVVCIIHGDGDYNFHDAGGLEYKADEEALAGMKRVAEANTQAEVFIFHEKPRRHFLLLFPRHDGEFYYYREGQLRAQESYWRDHGASRYDPEIALYDRFQAPAQPQPVRLFLYFGHEIPEIDGKGYDASYRDRTFTVKDLVDGLKSFTRDTAKFDLLVLASCFNGTPHTLSALTPYARYVMASPGNLHLSYFDLHPFESLDLGLRDGDVKAFARECAQRSFDRLAETMQTEITVAVYDVGRVQDYVRSVEGDYDQALAAWSGKTPADIRHCDCAEDSVYVRPAMSDGVDVLYRGARFGRQAHRQQHSGWECLTLKK
jgi:hypothetical protein